MNRLTDTVASVAAASSSDAGRRRGLMVALLGPDGAGKTTLAKALTAEPRLRARRIYMGSNARARDVALPGSRWIADQRAAARKGLSALAPAMQAFAFVHRLLDQWYRHLVAHVHCRRGGVVVFDRFTFEATEDALSTGHAVRRRLLRLGAPTPDLVIVLDAAPDVLLARKGEHSVERLERMRQSYAQLKARLPHAETIDTTRDPEAVKRAAIWLIDRRLARVRV